MSNPQIPITTIQWVDYSDRFLKINNWMKRGGSSFRQIKIKIHSPMKKEGILLFNR